MGASWTGQLVSLLTAVGFGAAAGIPALLFLRKARPLERALTDFAAVAAITAIYILSVEFGSDGQIKFYTLLGFAAGLLSALFLLKKLKARTLPKTESRSLFKRRDKNKFSRAFRRRT